MFSGKGAYLLLLGAIFLICVFVGWAIAFFSGLGNEAQSTYTGWGCLVGVVLAVIVWLFMRKGDSSNG